MYIRTAAVFEKTLLIIIMNIPNTNRIKTIVFTYERYLLFKTLLRFAKCFDEMLILLFQCPVFNTNLVLYTKFVLFLYQSRLNHYISAVLFINYNCNSTFSREFYISIFFFFFTASWCRQGMLFQPMCIRLYSAWTKWLFLWMPGGLSANRTGQQTIIIKY